MEQIRESDVVYYLECERCGHRALAMSYRGLKRFAEACIKAGWRRANGLVVCPACAEYLSKIK